GTRALGLSGEQPTAKAQCGGLSTALRFGRDDALVCSEKNRQRQDLPGEILLSHPCRGKAATWMGARISAAGLEKTTAAELCGGLEGFFGGEVGFYGFAGEEGFAHFFVFEELELVGVEGGV